MRVSRWTRFAVTAGVLMAVGGIGGRAVVMHVFASPAAPSLQSVSTRTLDLAAGVELQPPSSQPGATRQTAEKAAVQAYPGSAIREVILVNLNEKYMVPQVQRLAWVVSVAPAEGIWSSAADRNHNRIQLDYLLVFVDAKTGLYINSLRGRQLT
jgi:hypothetical protein